MRGPQNCSLLSIVLFHMCNCTQPKNDTNRTNLKIAQDGFRMGNKGSLYWLMLSHHRLFGGCIAYHRHELRESFPSCERVRFLFHIHFFLIKKKQKTKQNKKKKKRAINNSDRLKKPRRQRQRNRHLKI